MVGTALAALFLCAAQAVAATRYASPGSGDTTGSCPSAAPCRIDHAINGAGAGDEVVVEPGDYNVGSTDLVNNGGISVHGVDGQPRPRILTTALNGLQLGSAGSAAHWLEVDDSNGSNINALVITNGTADEVAVRASGGSSHSCLVERTSAIRDSLCANTGASGFALLVNATFDGPNSATIRNVTAVSTGSTSTGFYLNSTGGRSSSATIVNTIMRGVQSDISVDQSATAATVSTSHSNFRGGAFTHTTGAPTITDDGTSQTGEPLFVNAAGSDFREAAGSPTIDAGANDPANGSADANAEARTINGTTDIGAFEFLLAPAVAAGSASGVSQTAATITGSVNPNGSSTSYHFEYGLTSGYGSSTPTQSAGGGTATAAVSAALTGLAPGTTYHYRLVAANDGGTVASTDGTFTTPAVTFAGVRLGGGTVAVKNGVAHISVSCPAGTPGGCAGSVAITTAGRVVVPSASAAKRKRRRVLTLGHAHFFVAAGRTVKVSVRISKAGLKLLKRKPLKAVVKANAHNGGGATKLSSKTVKLKLVKKRRR